MFKLSNGLLIFPQHFLVVLGLLQFKAQIARTNKKGASGCIRPPRYGDIPHAGRDGTTAAPLKGKGSTVLLWYSDLILMDSQAAPNPYIFIIFLTETRPSESRNTAK